VPVESARLRGNICESPSSSSSPSLLLLLRFELEESSDLLSLLPKMFFSISSVVRSISMAAHRMVEIVLLLLPDAQYRRAVAACENSRNTQYYDTQLQSMRLDMPRHLFYDGRAGEVSE
jgi:hypothetical protein